MKLNLASKTILIIEDYPIMRKAIKDMLYTLGAQTIFEADNGYAAITALKKQKFDIILCDYNLGDGKNGQQVLEEARYKRYLSLSSIFIIVTAHQTASFVLNTIETKPDEYLAKPFNAQQLFRRLEKSDARKRYFLNIEREIEKGNPALAISHCDKLLNSNNKAIQSSLLKTRAELAINTGDFNKASTIYQQVLKQRELSWARLGTGIIAFFQNNHTQAISIFHELIEQNPLLMESYDWLSKSYEAIGNTDKAEETLNQATEVSPHSFFRQKKLAQLAEKIGHLDIAEKAYLAVTHLGEYSVHKSPGDFSSLAKIYSRKNKTQDALKILDSMRQQFLNNPETELRAATLETEIFHALGDEKLSQQAFNKIQQLSHEFKNKTPKELQLDIAKAYYLKKDNESADNIISSLVHNYIDDNNFMDKLRQMQKELGQENRSESLIQQTKQELVDINNSGVALFEQGKTKEALAIFNHAIEKMPHNKTIILNMATITIHHMKKSGVTEENLLLTHRYINKAKQAGVTIDKLGQLQLEFEKLTHTPSVL